MLNDGITAGIAIPTGRI